MVVISTWGSKSVEATDKKELMVLLQALLMFHFTNKRIFKQMSDETLKATLEEQDHHCKTLYLKTSGCLELPIEQSTWLWENEPK